MKSAVRIEPRPGRRRLRVAGAMLALWLGGCGAPSSAPAPAAVPAGAGAPAALPSLAPMLERAAPAVVNIATEGRATVRSNPLLDDPFFRRFFGLPEDMPTGPRTERVTGLGSGVIIDAAHGLILTNAHVVAQADAITVTLIDGRRFQAAVVGADADDDVALLRIAGRGLDELTLNDSDSDQLRVGDFVVAIGNPFGLGHSATLGIVSALGRHGLGLRDAENFIQTDASVNPGSSGGALVDLRGRLVGINTAILAPAGGNVGISFAIPVNNVKPLVRRLLR